MKKEYPVNIKDLPENECKIKVIELEDGRFEGVFSYHRQTMPQKDYNGVNKAPIEPKERSFSPVRGETEKQVLEIIKETLKEQFGQNVKIETMPDL